MNAVDATNRPMVGANPFSRRAVLAIVLVGTALFLALLWMIGTGNGFQSSNNGEAHADGRGLNGYAAMADYLARRGYDVRKARSSAGLNPEGLLVLTPPADADGKEIDRIVAAHRYDGPTLVIAPKWLTTPPSDAQKEKGAPKGWVNLVGSALPHWEGFLDDVHVTAERGHKGTVRWQGMGVSGRLPSAKVLAWGDGDRLLPLVTDGDDWVLAALVEDGGTYPQLEAMAERGNTGKIAGATSDAAAGDGEVDKDLYPLVVVFEPDLLDNYGMASPASARLIDALIPRLEVNPRDPIVFDMTLNGFGNARNLLTLAFTPPFLAATLCLILAAILVGWRALVRFGPAATPARAIAYGKRALVANSAGLIGRSRRFHLLRAPYAERARERL
ncbi:DUF4350 domain-containing protein, partial [Novosphingobium sp. 1949]